MWLLWGEDKKRKDEQDRGALIAPQLKQFYDFIRPKLLKNLPVCTIHEIAIQLFFLGAINSGCKLAGIRYEYYLPLAERLLKQIGLSGPHIDVLLDFQLDLELCLPAWKAFLDGELRYPIWIQGDLNHPLFTTNAQLGTYVESDQFPSSIGGLYSTIVNNDPTEHSDATTNFEELLHSELNSEKKSTQIDATNNGHPAEDITDEPEPRRLDERA